MSESTFTTHRYKRYYQQFEPLFKSQQAQAYTMIGISLLCITFFGIFAIRPTLKTIATLQKKITDSSELNDKLEAKINALIQAQDAYEKIQPDLPVIYSLLPDTPEFPSLLRRIENLAVDNGATLSGMQFDTIVLYDEKTEIATSSVTAPATVPDKGSVPVRFTLNFGGAYQNLLSLLEQLTNLDRLVTIYSVDLSLGSAVGEQSTLGVTVQSNAYYYHTPL